MTEPSFIEQQFPVARVSAESYKERMAGTGSSQTFPGVGKGWRRKPLAWVRACLSAEKVIERVERMQKALDGEMETLGQQIGQLKSVAG